MTDIPIGLLLGSVVLDSSTSRAADIVLLGTIVFMVLAAVSWPGRLQRPQGTALTRATLHATLMVVTLVILIVSALIRAGGPTDRALPIALSIIGFLLITACAFVGGDVAYVFGNMVSRHAFRGPGRSGSSSTRARSRTRPRCPRRRRRRCAPASTTCWSSASATRST